MTRRPSRAALLGLALLLVGCGGEGGTVALDLDKSRPEPIVRSVLGAFAGADPFEAGWVEGEGGSLSLRLAALPPEVRDGLAAAAADGRIDWDEWSAWVEAGYNAATGLPATLDALRREAAYGGDGWFTVDVSGVMSAARRRVHVPEAELRAALAAFPERDAIVYPAGTLIVGEHEVDGAIVETTVKRRRADGFWDFGVYDADGRLAPATATDPRPLRVPTQCTGCHLGQKRYEPEASWPAEARDGPFGPRAYHVPDAWRRAEPAALFEEHAARDDGVLGLYGTLYTSRLLAARDAGTLAAEDAELLDALGI